MIELTSERIGKLLRAFGESGSSREVFLRESKEVFLMLGDDAVGTEFKARVATYLENRGEPGLLPEQLAELAVRLNDPRIVQEVSKRLDEKTRKQYFPEISEIATTTANVAAFPVPLGMLSPSVARGPSYAGRKKKKSKKR